MKNFVLNLDEINKQNPFLTVAVGVILMLKANFDLEMTKHHRKGPNLIFFNMQSPFSLLPICSKIFEKLLFNELYKFLNENDLLSSNQSGLRPGDSWINKLNSITHEIYQSFDDGSEVRGVFLDILKAFDKVWHEGLILKLSRNDIFGNVLYLLLLPVEFFKIPKTKAGQNSSWKGIVV